MLGLVAHSASQDRSRSRLSALALGDVLSSFLVDMPGRNAVVTVLVMSGVAAVSVLSMAVAVARGLSIDPAAALREE